MYSSKSDRTRVRRGRTEEAKCFSESYPSCFFVKLPSALTSCKSNFLVAVCYTECSFSVKVREHIVLVYLIINNCGYLLLV